MTVLVCPVGLSLVGLVGLGLGVPWWPFVALTLMASALVALYFMALEA